MMLTELLYRAVPTARYALLGYGRFALGTPQPEFSKYHSILSPKSILTVLFVLLFSMLAATSPALARPAPQSASLAERCFAVSDETNGGNIDSLIQVDLDAGTVTNPRSISGGGSIEAVALVPDSQNPSPPAGRDYSGFTIYAANADTFGWLNFNPDDSGSPVSFVSLGRFTEDGRKASGSVNSRSLNDVDSLTFDSVNNIMYGVHRRFFESDLLFQIDLNTGHFIDDIFEDGDDYVEVRFEPPLHDVDDIAIHPITRKMYATINNRGVDGMLIEVDPATGNKIGEWRIQDNGMTINDIEGLAFSSTMELYGTTGEHGPEGSDQNQLYRINLQDIDSDATAIVAQSVAKFDSSADDVEGLGCLTSVTIVSEDPQIEVEKATNGLDADEPSLDPEDGTVPQLALGCPVTWTYEVTNTSTAAPPISLTNIVLVDDKIPGEIQCPFDTLAQGESMICSPQNGTATEARYSNLATVTADAVGSDAKASDTDPSHYNAYPGTIRIEKSTNGEDADEAPGPELAEGAPVNWEYVVTNMAAVAVPPHPDLTDIRVTDDMLDDGDISCPTDTLSPGESMTCTANGVAVGGQYRNVATVTARLAVAPIGACPITDTDPSHYIVRQQPGIALTKLTNGCGTAAPTDAPQLIAGWPVIWSYQVTNTGELPLSDIALVDDQVGAITCPSATLDVNEAMTCSAEGTTNEGAYSNSATVTASSDEGTVSAQDGSSYTGVAASLNIEKSTNGEDSDQAPGQMIPEGATVTWDYQITNTGDVAVKDIRVVDDQLAESDIDCGGVETLAPGASMNCSATGLAVSGQYTNTATVLAEPDVPAGESCRIDSSDLSHYLGVSNLAIGQSSEIGWSYVVTNTGETMLTDVSVDAGLGVVNCPQATLSSGESMPCSAIGTEAEFENEATVSAIDADSNMPVTVIVPAPQLDGLAMSIVIDGLADDEAQNSPFLVDSDVALEIVITNQMRLAVEGITAEFIDLKTGDRQPLACPNVMLAASESMSCQSSHKTTEGRNGIIATATGNLAGREQPVYADAAQLYDGVAYATVGGRIFIDELNAFGDANGLQEIGEQSLSIPDVEIELYNITDNQRILSTTIDSTGSYSFTNVWPGEYYIVVHRPPTTTSLPAPLDSSLLYQGFFWSAPNQLNNRVDSDAVPALDESSDIAKTETFRLDSGEVDMSWDIGFQELPMNGTAFIDADGDRIFDPEEETVKDVTIIVAPQLNPGGQAIEGVTSIRGTYELQATPNIYRITALLQGYNVEPVALPDTSTINFIVEGPILTQGIYLPLITSAAASGGK